MEAITQAESSVNIVFLFLQIITFADVQSCFTIELVHVRHFAQNEPVQAGIYSMKSRLSVSYYRQVSSVN